MREQGVRSLLYLWVQVYRVDELHLRVTQGKLGHGQADTLERRAEVLPSVAGDQHHALVIAQLCQG
ncbi:hypothetical protein D3C77_608080 [compost metagenome]